MVNTKYCKLGLLSLKYLWGYRRRYVFLFLALGFGFAVVMLLTTIKDEMYENVYNSAQQHYAGDIVITGVEKGAVNPGPLTSDEINAVYGAAAEARLNPVRIVQRTLFMEHGVVYFNGSAVRLKYLIGADWDNEALYFDSLDYEQPLDVSRAGPDTIVLSGPVAKQLGVRAGDSVILELLTRWGQKNTGDFIVEGIINDASIFGYYKAYVSRLTLNRLRLLDDGDCSRIGIFLADRTGIEKKRALFHDILSRHIATRPLVYSKNEQVKFSEDWVGVEASVLSLSVYLTEISDLLDAMNIITYFLYGLMLLIIFVSAVITYRLLLYERSRELGTMGAIGFSEGDIRFVLLAETLSLVVVSIIAGFILIFMLSRLLALVPFTWFPSLEIFLSGGRLRSRYLPKTVLINIIVIVGMMIAAVWIPAYRSSRYSLPKLLSGGDT